MTARSIKGNGIIAEKIKNRAEIIGTEVIETNIHYPTNNSLIWDCIKTIGRSNLILDCKVLVCT